VGVHCSVSAHAATENQRTMSAVLPPETSKAVGVDLNTAAAAALHTC
jgi:hypothetical protein